MGRGQDRALGQDLVLELHDDSFSCLFAEALRFGQHSDVTTGDGGLQGWKGKGAEEVERDLWPDAGYLVHDHSEEIGAISRSAKP